MAQSGQAIHIRVCGSCWARGVSGESERSFVAVVVLLADHQWIGESLRLEEEEESKCNIKITDKR